MNLWHGAPDDEAGHEELYHAGHTDGLPIVLPTPTRVRAMLEPHGYRPNDVLAVLPPLFQEATWQQIAIAAVMAGCKPAYLPLVGAVVEAMAEAEFNLLGVGTTTGSAAPLSIVNGPIAAELGINASGNALGPGTRANATIGRAISLVLRNVAGAKPGETDMATLGQPAKYTCCLAENEAESPWPPLHVERGFNPADNVVTVVAIGGTIEVVDSSSRSGEHLAQTYGLSLLAGTAGKSRLASEGGPLILMPPEIAAIFARDGYTKEKVKCALYEKAAMCTERLAGLLSEWFDSRDHRARQDEPPQRPEDMILVVAGGVGIKLAYAPAWRSSRAVSKRVRSSK